jgi:hypothetical protein
MNCRYEQVVGQQRQNWDSTDTEWAVDFKTPAWKYFFFSNAAQEIEEKKGCCRLIFQSLQPLQYKLWSKKLAPLFFPLFCYLKSKITLFKLTLLVLIGFCMS